MKNHPGSAKDTIIRIAALMRLGDGTFRTANKILLLIALDPEMLWIVCDIGKHRYQWPSRKSAMEAFIKRAIEVRDERHDHLRLRFPPVALEHPHHGTMVSADGSLQNPHELRAA